MSFNDLLSTEEIDHPLWEIPEDYDPPVDLDFYPEDYTDPVLRDILFWKGNGDPPKSFGSFYGRFYFEGFSSYCNQYLYVCRLNKWQTSRFKTYTPMIKWLRSNNAPDEVMDNVYGMAIRHYTMRWSCMYGNETYNTPDELEFLETYYSKDDTARTTFDSWSHPIDATSDLNQDF